MALEIRPNAIAQDQGPFLFPGVYIGPRPYPAALTGLRVATATEENLLFVNPATDRVGIGTAAPDVMLDIRGDVRINTTATPAIRFISTKSGTHDLLFRLAGGSDELAQFGPDTDGMTVEIGAGTINHAFGGYMTMSSTGLFRFFVDDNVEGMRMETDRGIYFYNLLAAAASTDVNINGSNELHSVTSSKRFKTKIRGLALDSSKIYDLRPRSFVWKQNSGSAGMEDFGVIAEEAYEIMPELVNLDADGKPWSLRYSPLTVLMLAELQKLNKRVEVLETV